MGTPIEEVLSPPYKTAFRTIAVIISVVAAFFVAQDRAAAFVDERVRVKTAAADKVMEEQARRLERLDRQMEGMVGNVNDIKVDVAKIRALLEAKGK